MTWLLICNAVNDGRSDIKAQASENLDWLPRTDTVWKMLQRSLAFKHLFNNSLKHCVAMYFLFLLHFLIITNADEWPPINIFKIMRKSSSVLGYLPDSNADAHFSTLSTMPNNNHQKIIRGFISLLSSVIVLKFSILAGLQVYTHVCVGTGICACLFMIEPPVILFGHWSF